MAAEGYRRITIKAASPFGPIQEEGLAAATITPGELLEIDSNGNLIPHDDEDEAVQGKLVALETIHADAQGTEQIDATYGSGDLVYYTIGQSGDVFYMWLEGSENVGEGDFLASGGSGNLHEITPGTDTEVGAVVAVAAEDLDLTAQAARARIKARII